VDADCSRWEKRIGSQHKWAWAGRSIPLLKPRCRGSWQDFASAAHQELPVFEMLAPWLLAFQISSLFANTLLESVEIDAVAGWSVVKSGRVGSNRA
jgi:hypothetical protein